MGSHFGIGAPPIVEPILVGIAMFIGGTGVRSFDLGVSKADAEMETDGLWKGAVGV